MNRQCHWCKRTIFVHREPYVTRTVRLWDNGDFKRYYHANVCYPAIVHFLAENGALDNLGLPHLS